MTALLLSTTSLPARAVEPPDHGCYIGCFNSGGSSNFLALTGRHLAIDMAFHSFKSGFPVAMASNAVHIGAIPYVSWEPWTGDVNEPGYNNQSIIDGTHDDYLRTYARDVKRFEHPLFLRFAHEMNGNWYPWDGTHSGGARTEGFGDPGKADGPERYIAAYRHVWEIFRAEGVTNVTWIWCPNANSVPAEDWNDLLNYYPGDGYVDWVGLDGYNFGDDPPVHIWRTCAEIFSEPYAKLKELGKPIIIGEMATGDVGGDKAAWITDCFRSLQNEFPLIKAFVWFNINKERDWRINSSPEAQAAFRAAMSNSYFSEIPTR